MHPWLLSGNGALAGQAGAGVELRPTGCKEGRLIPSLGELRLQLAMRGDEVVGEAMGLTETNPDLSAAFGDLRGEADSGLSKALPFPTNDFVG